jgi:Fe-S oxidoreductase
MVEAGKVPVGVKRFLENIERHGNPYGESRAIRGRWADGCAVEAYNGQEFLFYVGCTGSYDTRAQEAARALAGVLTKAGVSFGVLGSEETCDGNAVRQMGESGLFEMLAEENIARFKDLGVKKIITYSPHAYNTMKNDYPDRGGTFEVSHYTQILRDLMESGRIGSTRNLPARVAFHDPCYLGRWNSEYEAPRCVLNSIGDVKLVEMDKTGEGALCCGGGGGNFQLDLLGGSEDSPARRRVREAVERGVDVLAVACPKCLVMLNDAVTSEGFEGKLMVRDISEILAEALDIETLW